MGGAKSHEKRRRDTADFCRTVPSPGRCGRGDRAVTFSYSVVIPAYNAAATIREAIESIRGQTIPAHVIIVVDDGSTDGTAADARATGGPITGVSQDNRGPGAATSGGVSRVGPPFLATLDADDLPPPARIALQAGTF